MEIIFIILNTFASMLNTNPSILLLLLTLPLIAPLLAVDMRVALLLSVLLFSIELVMIETYKNKYNLVDTYHILAIIVCIIGMSFSLIFPQSKQIY